MPGGGRRSISTDNLLPRITLIRTCGRPDTPIVDHERRAARRAPCTPLVVGRGSVRHYTPAHVRTLHLPIDLARDRQAVPTHAGCTGSEYSTALQHLPHHDDRRGGRARRQARAGPDALGPHTVVVVQTAQ